MRSLTSTFGISSLRIVFIAFVGISHLAGSELHAGGPRRGGMAASRSGGATQYRSGLFNRPVAQATTSGSTTTYRGALSVRPAMSAVTSGNVTTYETRGLFGRRVNVAAATTTGTTTTYTQPGLFGRDRAVMTAEQHADAVVYRDSLGRKLGSAAKNSQGNVEYRGPLGRKLYSTTGEAANPRRDGFVELYRRQQENAALVDDILGWEDGVLVDDVLGWKDGGLVDDIGGW